MDHNPVQLCTDKAIKINGMILKYCTIMKIVLDCDYDAEILIVLRFFT